MGECEFILPWADGPSNYMNFYITSDWIQSLLCNFITIFDHEMTLYI